jgi:hypothetical protein
MSSSRRKGGDQVYQGQLPAREMVQHLRLTHCVEVQSGNNLERCSLHTSLQLTPHWSDGVGHSGQKWNRRFFKESLRTDFLPWWYNPAWIPSRTPVFFSMEPLPSSSTQGLKHPSPPKSPPRQHSHPCCLLPRQLLSEHRGQELPSVSFTWSPWHPNIIHPVTVQQSQLPGFMFTPMSAHLPEARAPRVYHLCPWTLPRPTSGCHGNRSHLDHLMSRCWEVLSVKVQVGLTGLPTIQSGSWSLFPPQAVVTPSALASVFFV